LGISHSQSMGIARLRPATIVLAASLITWFGLDFVGWPRLVDREPLMSLAGSMLALMLLFIVGGISRLGYLAIPYFVALGVWAVLQWQTHWSTYLLPASPAKLDWYGRIFGNHWRLLPDRAGHTTPDTYHTVLAVLILCNLVWACADIFARRRFDDALASPPQAQGDRD
jgi:hypothetical protein